MLHILFMHNPNIQHIEPAIPADMEKIIPQIKTYGKIHHYFFKFAYYKNKFTLADLEYENVASHIDTYIHEHIPKGKILIIALGHACPYALYYVSEHQKNIRAIICFPFRFYCKESYERRIWKLKNNKGYETFIKKYNVDDHLINITEKKFAIFFDKPAEEEKQAIFFCFDLSIQKQYDKIPNTFTIPTILFTRLDIDEESVIKYNYHRKEIAKMKQIINEDDALYNSMIWNFDRVKHDALLRKNDKNNGMLKFRYIVSGWENSQDICDEVNNLINISPKRIFLIRHGQTDENVAGICQGQEIDSELNLTGIEQARLTGRYLRYHIHGRQIIWTSPQKRATKTASIISDQIGVRCETVNLLKEVRMGKLSGLNCKDKLKKEVKDAEEEWDMLHGDPITRNNSIASGEFFEFMEDCLEKYDIGAESHNDLTKRVTKIKRMIEKSDYQTIFIVSHSGLLEVLIQNLLGVIEYPRGNLKNAKNCWVSLIELNQNSYRMLCAPNTEHIPNIK